MVIKYVAHPLPHSSSAAVGESFFSDPHTVTFVTTCLSEQAQTVTLLWLLCDHPSRRASKTVTLTWLHSDHHSFQRLISTSFPALDGYTCNPHRVTPAHHHAETAGEKYPENSLPISCDLPRVTIMTIDCRISRRNPRVYPIVVTLGTNIGSHCITDASHM